MIKVLSNNDSYMDLLKMMGEGHKCLILVSYDADAIDDGDGRVDYMGIWFLCPCGKQNYSDDLITDAEYISDYDDEEVVLECEHCHRKYRVLAIDYSILLVLEEII